MDKTILLQVLQRYASTSLDEAKELAALRGQYPYSQILHTLTARASKDHALQQQQRDLQLAARAISIMRSFFDFPDDSGFANGTATGLAAGSSDDTLTGCFVPG